MTGKVSRSGRFHGILVVDKPAGWTSHDVVARSRRLLGERHIGHAGTLDPAATGVLPLAVGDATKVLEYLSDASKTYLAEITFGVETDSHDADGRVTRVASVDGLGSAEIEVALVPFAGEIEQVPPMHSALKVGGRRLYELARAGVEVERLPRQITIDELRLIDWQPPVATVLVDCSKGTYVRAIARDLGQAIGTGAHLSNLVRLRTGPFTLDEAWTLEELAEVDFEAEWASVAVHPDEAMRDRPVLVLASPATGIWTNGGHLDAADGDDGPVRVYDAEGTWLGVGRFDAVRGQWRPVKVVRVAA
ncbi:MAG: tRNA pseudouridine55 synthase [Thermomicrobiales bacterium]|nr:tRNA pseudouridine55 synthase [Thermomicrobiales bacterium]